MAVVVTVAAVVVTVAAGDVVSVNLERYQREILPRRSELPGGAVLLEIPVPGSQAVSFGVWLRHGSAAEPKGLEGISHFIEHIVFKGSADYSALQIAQAFDSVGAVVDAFTTKDYVAFTLKVLPEFFAGAITVLADMLLRPALAADLIVLEQDVVCEEIQEALDTPEDRLHDAFAARVYTPHRRGLPILGTPRTVRGFGPDIVGPEHERLFSAPNLVLSLAGVVEPATSDLVRALFADLAVSAATVGELPAAVDPEKREASDLVIESAVLQTYFEFGNLGVATSHPDRVAVLLLGNLLGGGMSSRIFQAVREREGLAYTIYTYTDMGLETGLVSCAGSCSPDKEARLSDVVRTEYARMLADGPTKSELDGNKAQIKSHLVFALEGAHNQMYRAAKNEIFFGRFLPVLELVSQVDAVDHDAVVRCAREWFDPDRMVKAVHRPVVSS